jgi:hypothetical protein
LAIATTPIGAERFDHNADEDRDVWKKPQAEHNATRRGHDDRWRPGPRDDQCADRGGYPRGVWALKEPAGRELGLPRRRRAVRPGSVASNPAKELVPSVVTRGTRR